MWHTVVFKGRCHDYYVCWMRVSAENAVVRAGSVKPAKHVSEPGNTDTVVVRWITQFYHKWALFVADHAIVTIVICTILSLVGTAKIVTTPNENDITGYTPYGARARDELGVAAEFFSRGGSGLGVFLLILPKDGGNALRLEVLDEALGVEETLSTNFTMLNPLTNQNESYREFCISFCQINQPFVQFASSYIGEKSLADKGEPINPRIDLSYPISTFYNRQINIQPHFFGLEFEEDELPGDIDSNSTEISKKSRVSNLKSVKMLALQLQAERKQGWTTQMIKDFEISITQYFERDFVSSNIRVLTLSTTYVESEVVRAGMSLLPFLIVGFAIMACVSSLTTFLSALFMDQVSIHKFSLAIMACICPFMACGTALGALFFIGVRFGSILCVTPFLVLAIGVDDAYLMIHSWQRVTMELRKNPVKGDCAAYRLAQVLSDTGPAIMISALTNMSADAVGAFTSSPEITLLCYGNAACIFVDFVYQCSKWCWLVDFEVENEREQSLTQRVECGAEDPSDSLDQKSVSSLLERLSGKFSTFLDSYVAVVTNKAFDLAMVVIWIIFLGISIKGITQMPINLTPKKLFSKDSSLQEMDDLRVSYVIPHFTLATVFVNNPGNLSDVARQKRLNSFVAEMESLPGAWGNKSSNYFLRDFVAYEKGMSEFEPEEGEWVKRDANTLNFKDLPAFLEWPEYEFWKGFLRFDENSTKLERFFFTTAYHGDDLRQWINRDKLLKSWRRVVDNYAPEFNTSVYYDDGIYLDLIENMPTDTWQSAVATICCMATVCFIFMWDLPTVLITTGVIASIMTGILGTLSWTGTELDPIVMAALIISIGFSVDIPAHVSYHYYSAGSHIPPPITTRTRLHYCLSSVGFPALQASLSTSLCVLALLLVSIYMSQVFVKTMILCMILCVTHGLLLIPCLVSLADPLLDKLRGPKKA
ncbi:patched family protein [Ancylostoma ceylanicum]|uniref:Patched family protein n=1 Tax=Ancylostoma ceylanicum TaxID=53326 RepID=A0A0D6LRD6_9BILA|nr:patched family protein [Ancylostoma ceylanicum]